MSATPASPSPNAPDWTAPDPSSATQRWLAAVDVHEARLAPVSSALFDRAALQPGESVLDIGCGPGSTTREATRRTGVAAIGVDISPPMLAEARAHNAGLDPAPTYLVADAESDPLPEADVVISRFGVMFFDDAPAAFARIGAAAKDRIALAVWDGLAANPWLAIPRAAAAKALGLPLDDVIGTPGPLGLGDRAYVERLIAASGLGGLVVHPVDITMWLGSDGLDSAVGEALDRAPVMALLAQSTMHNASVIASEAIGAALASYMNNGRAELPGRAWILTARRFA